MALQNSLAPKAAANKGNKLSDFLNKNEVKAKLLGTLGTEKALTTFTANITSAVANNPGLQECDYGSIVSAGLMASALELPITPSLGFVHLVPFKDRKNNRTVATFILGYKGYIQLAIRSGFYAKINVTDVKEGELIYYDPFYEKLELKRIENDEEREKLRDVGYCARFELLNGFSKTIYWSKEKMLAHADRYSAAFSLNATTGKYPKVSYADYEAGKYPEGTEWLYSSYWYKDFAGMAMKTLIRQLISKWGIMSIEMQNEYDRDSANMDAADKQAFDFVPPQEQAAEEFFDEQPEEKEKKPAKAKAKKEEPPEPDDDDDFFGDNPFAEAVE